MGQLGHQLARGCMRRRIQTIGQFVIFMLRTIWHLSVERMRNKGTSFLIPSGFRIPSYFKANPLKPNSNHKKEPDFKVSSKRKKGKRHGKLKLTKLTSELFK
jgi:hypothetical protein